MAAVKIVHIDAGKHSRFVILSSLQGISHYCVHCHKGALRILRLEEHVKGDKLAQHKLKFSILNLILLAYALSLCS